MELITTLKAIRKHGPCGLRPEDDGSLTGYLKLKAYLGEEWADDSPVAFSQILASNGLDDTLWCLRSICPKHDKEVRLFAADCAERVLHLYEEKYPNDKRPRLAIEAARAYARGEITDAAWGAASDAASDAASAASSAAARAAASAASDAASDAARAASSAAARAAASDAADAARGAEQKIQAEMLIKYFDTENA